MFFSGQEKEQILNKYKDNISEEVLKALKRRFPVEDSDWKINGITPKMVQVGEKSYWIEYNKKYLVGKISSLIESNFIHIETSILRRTVKFYLDYLK